MANGNGVFNALQTRRPLAPGFVAEIAALRTGSHNQRVVRDAGAVFQSNKLRCRVHFCYFAEKNAAIFLMAKNRAQRGTDLSGRESTGGDLIQQWLKQVKIPFVNQRYFDRSILQRLRSIQTAKSASNNNYFVFIRHENSASFQLALCAADAFFKSGKNAVSRPIAGKKEHT